MSFPVPFDRYRGEVRPEWIDANGHMNLAYYIVLFDWATDALYDALGIGIGYKEATNNGTFAVETHTLYRRELLLGDKVGISTRILGSDAKRLHLAHEMQQLGSGEAVAMQELLYLHVDLVTRRVSPFPEDARRRIAEARDAHGSLPRPDWVGRRISLSSK